MNLIKHTFEAFPLVVITAEAEQKRDDLICQSSEIKHVTNAVQQNSAVDAARAIRTYVKDAEGTRVKLTKPLLDAQRLLKRVADEHVAPLVAEQERVERMVTVFQEAEQRRVQAEIEARRIAYETAERDRLAAEQLGMDDEAKAIAEHVQDIIMAAMPEASKSAGASTSKVMRYEVTDIAEIYKVRPDLVKLEIKAAAVLSTCRPELPVPGLKLWLENSTSIRSY
jgi:hypothetical protein